MPNMNINLQVVGIFYNSTVAVQTAKPNQPPPTVKDLLDAAVAQPNSPGDTNPASSFTYTTNGRPSGEMFASSFHAVYDKPVNGRVVGKATYPPGEYFLDEQLSARPAYTVWQYYLFDADGRYLNQHGLATPFTKQSLINVPYAIGTGSADVARVTWRLVSILGQPTTPRANNDAKLIAGSAPSMRT